MDNRRIYGLRAPRPIGYSTFMVPQLENYSLFACPYMELSRYITTLIRTSEDKKDQTEKEGKIKGKAKPKEVKSDDKKPEEEKSAEEDRKIKENFGIVLNVAALEPGDVSITFGADNEIELKVNQKDYKLERMDLTFSRNCSYKYQLPVGVDKKSLVALWTSDDFLIISPREVMRQDLLEKSVRDAIARKKSDEKDAVTPMEIDDSEDKGEVAEPKGSDSKASEPKKRLDSKPKKGSDSQDTKEAKPRKGSDSKEGKAAKSKKGSDSQEVKEPQPKGSKSDAGETSAEKDEDPSEMVFVTANGLTPVPVARMLRQGLDIFMLRKYVVDLESYLSTVRNFIENASFISKNSRTPEVALRDTAKENTREYFDKMFKEGRRKKIPTKLDKEASQESGYTSTSSEKSSERLPAETSPSGEATDSPVAVSTPSPDADATAADASDESSRGSSTKSGGAAKEARAV